MPFAVRRRAQVVARVTAVVNPRYNSHWNERIGQLIHFEALPGEAEGVAAMLEEAAGWLRERGMTAARSGFAAFLDYPYSIDNYGRLPPFLLRGSPEYYHTYFKDAGFQTEKGMTDFTIALTPDILARYPAMIEQTMDRGIRIRSWREHGFAGRGGRVDRHHQRGVRAPLGMEPDYARGSAPDAGGSGTDRGRRPLDSGGG